MKEVAVFLAELVLALVVAAIITILAIAALVVAVHWLGSIIHASRRHASPLPSDAARLRSRMRRLARPTLLLVPATALGASKLGGEPELPEGMAWPEVRGRPCAFLAQVDLSTFQQHTHFEWLPNEGLIFAFVDLEGHGFEDQMQVRFSAGPPGEPRSPPARRLIFPERRVAFERYTSLPSLDWLGVDIGEVELNDQELDDLSGLPDEPFGDEVQHRIGGYPSEIQSDRMGVACELIRRGLPADHEVTPAIERASKAWRMLLQVDSDPALKMNWGDAGRFYVFIREQDAKAGDFSRTITISQTH